MNKPQCVVVLCACTEGRAAEKMAQALVNEGLVACVNRIPGVVSNFRWQGRVEEAYETLLMMKTTANQLEALCERIKALHNYELPEIIAIPVTGGHEAYLDWVRDSVSSATGA